MTQAGIPHQHGPRVWYLSHMINLQSLCKLLALAIWIAEQSTPDL